MPPGFNNKNLDGISTTPEWMIYGGVNRLSHSAHRGWLTNCDYCYNCVGTCCGLPNTKRFTLDPLYDPTVQESLGYISLKFCNNDCAGKWELRQQVLETGRNFVHVATV